MSRENSNAFNIAKYISKVSIDKDLLRKVSTRILKTMEIDKHTAENIKERIISTGNYSYVSLIKKHYGFLTPVRLMVLVDYVDILKGIRYYLNDYNSSKYDKNLSNNYNLITGLHAAELKLIMLEHLYEIFNGSTNLGVIFHEPVEKIDAVIELDKPTKINLTDNDGYVYVNTLNPGTYMFESRSCSSITDPAYILNNDKRQQHIKNCDRYFLFIPRDATVSGEVIRELERNNVRIMFSNYTTIDIVNDVAYMEGIMNRE